MTPSQIKHLTESLFEEQGKAMGKQCFIHRFFDNSDLMNRGNRGHASLPRSPSDYMVTINGRMFYAEVKGTELDKFSLKRIEASQWGAMTQVAYAGGDYIVFIYHVPNQTWSIIPHSQWLKWSKNDVKSITLEGTDNDWTTAFS